MKKIPVIISLAIMAFLFATCSDEKTFEGEIETVDHLFQQMKATYRGGYMLPNNVPQPISITIDERANVVVDKFPLDLVFAKLYPSDYSTISESAETTGLVAPIKGFNMNNSLIEFSTDIDNTEPIEFTFTKDDAEHTGWAMVYVVGIYNPYWSTLTLQLSVVDLIVDGQDMKSLTPIVYFIDSAVKE